MLVSISEVGMDLIRWNLVLNGDLQLRTVWEFMCYSRPKDVIFFIYTSATYSFSYFLFFW